MHMQLMHTEFIYQISDDKWFEKQNKTKLNPVL